MSAARAGRTPREPAGPDSRDGGPPATAHRRASQRRRLSGIVWMPLRANQNDIRTGALGVRGRRPSRLPDTLNPNELFAVGRTSFRVAVGPRRTRSHIICAYGVTPSRNGSICLFSALISVRAVAACIGSA